MRTGLNILLLIMLAGCSTTLIHKRPDRVYYLSYKSDGQIDTVKYSKVSAQPAKAYRLLDQERFTHVGKAHLIRFYVNDQDVPADGGELYYTLDTLGIIYSRAIHWPRYAKLHTSNESVAELINLAIDHILQDPRLHSYGTKEFSAYAGKNMPADMK